MSATQAASRTIVLADLGREPFRVFFPMGVLAGLVGVGLWPLHFVGAAELYPGQAHARIMVLGLFGGFILGFLGTALPRLLGAPSLGLRNVILLAGLHGGMVACFAGGKIAWGDHLSLGLLLGFVGLMAWRFGRRNDTPPPGFVLVGLAFLCGVVGAALAVWQHYQPELASSWVMLQRLLSYQGFVLLPILGVGPFLLPRFFGLESSHEFPEMVKPTAVWIRKAALALVVGGVIVGSFIPEAGGEFRLAYTTRFLAVLVYLFLESPFRRAPRVSGGLGRSLQMAFAALLAGLLSVVGFPVFRIALLHLTLIGGFAVITFVVATRVVYGHSGNRERLQGRNRWLLIAVGLMLVAMVTRISGDFWPAIMVSHYVYGALLWAAGVLVWGGYVLPSVLRIEED